MPCIPSSTRLNFLPGAMFHKALVVHLPGLAGATSVDYTPPGSTTTEAANGGTAEVSDTIREIELKATKHELNIKLDHKLPIKSKVKSVKI